MGISTNGYKQLCQNLGLNPVTGLGDGAANKFNARKKELDGYTFHSTAEARRYVELKAMRDGGLIQNLLLQPPFTLQEGFLDSTGKKQRRITYVADFQYRENGKLVVEDVKGFRTQVYIVKRKLFLKRFPEIDFREIGKQR